MGKYAASIGIWEHEIDGVVNKIKPEEQDNLKFVEIKKKAEKAKDELILTNEVGQLYFDMVIRSDKSLSEEDKKELKTWISININKIVTDFMIQFKWTTQEKLDKIEESQSRIQEEVQKKKMMMELEPSNQKEQSNRTSSKP